MRKNRRKQWNVHGSKRKVSRDSRFWKSVKRGMKLLEKLISDDRPEPLPELARAA